MASDSGSDSGLKGESSNQSEDHETKNIVEETWKKMNAGLPSKLPKPAMHKLNSSTKPKTNKSTPDWMIRLGLAPKQPLSGNTSEASKNTSDTAESNVGEDAKKQAAAALAAVREAALNSQIGKGKVQITEVRDFAGEEIQITKLVDADSKEAEEENSKSKSKSKSGGAGSPSTALDSVLEQIKKKPKLSVLDKTKKDWGEFKEENKGVEHELDAYKKSSNQYLDKVSFLQRTDYREFERERDVRLAMQSKRKMESSGSNNNHDF